MFVVRKNSHCIGAASVTLQLTPYLQYNISMVEYYPLLLSIRCKGVPNLGLRGDRLNFIFEEENIIQYNLDELFQI